MPFQQRSVGTEKGILCWVKEAKCANTLRWLADICGEKHTKGTGCSRQGWRGAGKGEFLPLKSPFMVKELNGKG